MTQEQFGHYRIEASLGRGGMGVVHRAMDTRKDRLVALKRLPEDLADDVRFVERFSREARLTATLSDPHVIPIHDYGEIRGRLYLDMRLVEGVDLESLLRDGPLGPERTATIIGQVAGALDAAHYAGLVHRDVKPSNILLSQPPYVRDGESPDFAYLIDFGIGANIADSRLTTTGQVVGTVAYMAPERFAAEHRADLRADVYALGCVLHQCLTGLPPFRGDNMQLMYAHMHATPPRPTAGRTDLSPALDKVVATAMAKDPDRRYPRAGALAAALRAAFGPAEATAPPARTWKSIAAAVRGVVARPPTRQPPPVPPRRTARLDDSAQQVRPDARRARPDHPPAPRTRPDDQRTRQAETPLRPPAPGPPDRDRPPEVAAPPPEPEPRQLPVAELVQRIGGVAPIGRRSRSRGRREVDDDLPLRSDVPRPRPLRVPGRGHSVVAFDPSGHLLATNNTAEPGTVLWDLEEGQVRRRVPRTLFATRVSAIAFGPDGARTATAVRNRSDSGAGVHEVVVDAVDGSSTTVLMHEEAVVALAFSPDGEHLATASGDRTVAVWSVRTGLLLERNEAPGKVLDLAYSPDGAYLALAGAGARLRDLRSPQSPDRRLVSGEGTEIRHLSFSSSARTLAVAGPDDLAVVWDVIAGVERERHRCRGPVRVVAISPDGTRLAAGGGNGAGVTVWAVGRPEPLGTYARGTEVTDIEFDPTGEAIAIAGTGSDANVVVVDAPR